MKLRESINWKRHHKLLQPLSGKTGEDIIRKYSEKKDHALNSRKAKGASECWLSGESQ